ncbi:MAG: hypothetical protein HN742_05610 [Lentisphaerae bacterium]|jgi:hypothetical protein|nr:hypothetical protein [Lentisphaerota bacterium]MBT4821386.1 hypothetical protein [Lentisphaerota bacterium]MBT5606924.1 hypothetical protein [Lentisphaerota bacterium]MBT7054507.1 hypothetical protein [Lentisphaerota bacterium]MBT7841326.1 hypothetical protein [Lentisphaerota bacterium]
MHMERVCGRRAFLPLVVVSVVLFAGAVVPALDLYVCPLGNDAWSGTLPAPNATRSDGPLAGLAAARDTVRRWRKRPERLNEPVTVHVRGGEYTISEPVSFTPDDSGTAQFPITYKAFEGERPVLCGGRRITGWERQPDGTFVADIPEARNGTWLFRSLFVNGRRQTRARYPNVDLSDPYRSGFLFSEYDPHNTTASCIHNVGDWMDYAIDVPTDGTYRVWTRYAAQNGTLPPPCLVVDNMGDRCALSVGGGEPTFITNLPDTGSWKTQKWSRNTTMAFTKGSHTLRWQNLKGGGIDIDCFVFTTDPEWKPDESPVPPPASGHHLFVVHAETYIAFEAPQLKRGTAASAKDAPGTKKRVPLKPGTAKPTWAATGQAELHIFPTSYYTCRAFKVIGRITSVLEDGSEIRLDGTECRYDLAGKARFFVENVKEELDAPGEWFLDTSAGRLYYRPETDSRGLLGRLLGRSAMTNQAVYAPMAGRVLEVLGGVAKVEHLRFEGLHVRVTDFDPEKDDPSGYRMGREGVFHFERAAHCEVRNCRFANIGKTAVCAVGCEDLRIAGNTILDSAEGGVTLRDKSHRNRVEDNVIDDIGRVYKHVAGVTIDNGGDDNVIVHNRITRSSRYGISLKYAGVRTVIEYNDVHHVNLETYDTGAIEVTQRLKSEPSDGKIRHNLVHHSIGYGGIKDDNVLSSSNGIYLDSFAAGYEVAHNLVYACDDAVFVQGGRGNTVHDNILAAGGRSQIRYANHRQKAFETRVFRNVMVLPNPDVVVVNASAVDLEHLVECDRNLIFATPDHDALFAARIGGAVKRLPLDEWRKLGHGAASVLTDPLFANSAADDYRLRPDSPALKPEYGFVPIDLSKVGPRR